MFSVGTALPLRDPGLRSSLGKGVRVLAISAVLALVAGLGLAQITNLHRPLMIAVLAVTSSAALVMPALEEAGLTKLQVGMVTAAWVTLADIGSVVALPFVVVHGSVAQRGDRRDRGAGRRRWRSGRSCARRAVGSGTGSTVGSRIDAGGASICGSRCWRCSPCRWLALKIGTSVLVAGFCAGAIVALVGEPKRLAWEILGIGQGFFVPLFFVVLGAQISLRALLTSPGDLLLAVTLSIAIVAVHVAAGLVARLPLGSGLVATAQMGVPAALVAVGLADADRSRPGRPRRSWRRHSSRSGSWRSARACSPARFRAREPPTRPRHGHNVRTGQIVVGSADACAVRAARGSGRHVTRRDRSQGAHPLSRTTPDTRPRRRRLGECSRSALALAARRLGDWRPPRRRHGSSRARRRRGCGR